MRKKLDPITSITNNRSLSNIKPVAVEEMRLGNSLANPLGAKRNS